jgi:hypothetical protein
MSSSSVATVVLLSPGARLRRSNRKIRRLGRGRGVEKRAFGPERRGGRFVSDKRTLSDIQTTRQARRITRENT